MEMETRTILKDNLKTLYDIEIWMLGCLVLALVPFANVLVIIAAPILAIIGVVAQVRLRKIHPDYQKAIIALVVGLLCNLVGRGDSSFAGAADIAGSLAGLFQTYCIIRATNDLLTEINAEEEKQMGDSAWRWNLYSTIASIIVSLVAISSLTLLLSVVQLVIAIVALIHYMRYLKFSSEAF